MGSMRKHEKMRSIGRAILMILVAITPAAVVTRIMTADSGIGEATRKANTEQAAVAKKRASRRLQSESYNFATQLEMTVCLNEEHSSDSASVSPDMFKNAVAAALDLENLEHIQVDDSLTKCTYDDWQRRVSIFNEQDGDRTAADIASEQVDYIYVDPGPTLFFQDISDEVYKQDEEINPQSSDFQLLSLGFLVIWLEEDGEVVASQGTSKGKDVHSIGGTDVWWPWWAWLIYAAVVVACICPVLYFFFKWRRDKEAEEEGFGAGGKDMGRQAPPSATSTNPYGGNYTTGEEYKNGQ